MKFPVRTELLILPRDDVCPECKMRIVPGRPHTWEECVVAQIHEVDETLGWSITEKVGIGVFNSRAITKIVKK